MAMIAQTPAARKTPTYGWMPQSLSWSTAYAPRPKYACWPTETSPAYPASRFHMLARVSSMKKVMSVSVTVAYAR
ncbi:MAG: hypothetical protein QOE03_3737 [Micromonosporaceae bacterium]|jgi:hypothetical protein|nr:hypothetical protein [Micromonosporaceae bacterium]